MPSISLSISEKISLSLSLSHHRLLRRESSATTMTEAPQPSQPPSPPPPTTTPAATLQLHPRREPFEHGLIPIQKLIFTVDPQASLTSLKRKLLATTSTTPPNSRIGSDAISQSLQISPDQSRLVLETIASVHHSDSDPLVKASPGEIESVGVEVDDLIMFLYVQSYKRLLPRTHKDSASVADVWPSHSAFDGYLSALSPLQLVRSNSRRFLPSQNDEEAHQLSYLRKHLGNILSLLAEPGEGDEESLVLTMEKLEHLGFLIQFSEKGSERLNLSQTTPFFANSDPDTHAFSVTQVHDWLQQQIISSLEHISERGPSKDNDACASDQDGCASPAKAPPSAKGPVIIEGISKSSFIKQTSDLEGSSVKVMNCNDTVIYVLAPLRYATIYGCSDATIVLGAVGKAVRVEHCERVHVITATRRICIANCRECVFFLGVNQRPLIVGNNQKLQVAPYNTSYPQLVEHMSQAGIDATINKWDEPLALGIVEPHDSIFHPAGDCDVQAELAACVDPEHFTNFLIPDGLGGERPSSTEDIPFPLPDAYMTRNQANVEKLGETKQMLREVPLEYDKKRELSGAIHLCFKDWLYASGNIRQLYCQQSEEIIR